MRKLLLLLLVMFVSVLCTACINNIAIQELNNKAKEYLEKGDNANAICRLESSVDLDANVLETRYNLGVAYINDEQYELAETHLLQAIKLNPQFADAYFSLAVAQENLASQILEPKNSDENEIIEVEISDDTDENGVKNVSEDVARKYVMKLIEAQTAYEKYLEISKEQNDEISSQIDYIKETVQKYSDKYNLLLPLSEKYVQIAD